MAISIDTIYQRVLSIANKEQRGYITPQEFNLLANIVQAEIFEDYFYELDRLRRQPSTHNSELTDRIEIIIGKLKKFMKTNVALAGDQFPSDMYRLDTLYHKTNECQRMDRDEYLSSAGKGGLLKPTQLRPVYFHRTPQKVNVYNPALIAANLKCDYVRKPNSANWGYVVTNEKALYNSLTSTNFELHQSEKAELVYRILELAGITIAKPGLAQLGDAMEKEMTQKEKQ